MTGHAQQPSSNSYQIHRDLIRGRVATDSGVVIPGADIAVTMAPDRVTVQLKILPGNSRFLFESKEPIRNVRFFSSSAC